MAGDVASSIHWDDTSASDIALAVIFAGTSASVIVGARFDSSWILTLLTAPPP
jgi:hypothetical protein